MSSDHSQFVDGLNVLERRVWTVLNQSLPGQQQKAKSIIEKLSSEELELLVEAFDDRFNEGHGCGSNDASC